MHVVFNEESEVSVETKILCLGQFLFYEKRTLAKVIREAPVSYTHLTLPTTPYV